MLGKLIRLVMLLGLVVSVNAVAAVIQVLPGKDTLKNAVEAAADGDTLVLITGVYTGSVNITDKSLTIRAGSSTKPVLSDMTFGFNNETKTIKIQGLYFFGQSGYGQNIGDQYTLIADSVDIVNSHFEDALVNIKGNKVNVVGSDFRGQIVQRYDSTKPQLWVEQSAEVYLAGNTFDKYTKTTQAQVLLKNNGNNYVAGNLFSRNGVTVSNGALFVEGGTQSYVVGNRIEMKDYSYSVDTPFNGQFINTTSNRNFVFNNLFEVDSKSGFDTKLSAMRFVSTSNYAEIVNNNIIVNGAMAEPENTESAAIEMTGNAKGVIAGNILLNVKGNQIKDTSTNQFVNISHNLCPGVEGDVTCANTAITFDSTVNYSLPADSPAVNAGIQGDYFDIDGSRQDIGLHGGPWGFDFYDAQRSDDTKPYLYPYFDQISLKSSGQVDIKVLSVARFN